MSEKVVVPGYSAVGVPESVGFSIFDFLTYVNRLPHDLHLRNGRKPKPVVLRWPLATVWLDLQYGHLIGLPRGMFSPP